MTSDELECRECKYKWWVDWDPMSTLDSSKACCPRCKTAWKSPHELLADMPEEVFERMSEEPDDLGSYESVPGREMPPVKTRYVDAGKGEPLPHGEVSDMPEVVPAYTIKCPDCKMQWSGVQFPAKEEFAVPCCPFCKVPMLLRLERAALPLPSPAIDYLRLEPGDVLILKVPQVVARKRTKKKLMGTVQMAFPGHEVMLMDGGVDLKVVRPSKATEAGT